MAADNILCESLAENNFGVNKIYLHGLEPQDVNKYFSERLPRYVEELKKCTIGRNSNYEEHFLKASYLKRLFSSNIATQFEVKSEEQRKLFNLFKESDFKTIPKYGTQLERFNLFKSLTKAFYTAETIEIIKKVGRETNYNGDEYVERISNYEDINDLVDPDSGELSNFIFLVKDIYNYLLKQISFRDWESKYYLENYEYNYKVILNHFKYRSTLRYWAQTIKYEISDLNRNFKIQLKLIERGQLNQVDFSEIYAIIKMIIRIVREIRSELIKSIHINYEDDDDIL